MPSGPSAPIDLPVDRDEDIAGQDPGFGSGRARKDGQDDAPVLVRRLEDHPGHVVLEWIAKVWTRLEHHALPGVVERDAEPGQGLASDEAVAEIESARVLMVRPWKDRHELLEREVADFEPADATHSSFHGAGESLAEACRDRLRRRTEPRLTRAVEPERVARSEIDRELGRKWIALPDGHARVQERTAAPKV